jgi:hypothetical protein
VAFNPYDEVEVGGEVDTLWAPCVAGAFARGWGRADFGKDIEDGCIQAEVLFGCLERIGSIDARRILRKMLEDCFLIFVTGLPVLDVDFWWWWGGGGEGDTACMGGGG